MTTALVSALSGIPVRADVAMTGEITLRGEVTAIGGLKEKLLAAHRGASRPVLIPEENVKDLQDIPENGEEQPRDRAGQWIDRGPRSSRSRRCRSRWPSKSWRRKRPRSPRSLPRR
jgi:ATP-dependent Lon protease